MLIRHQENVGGFAGAHTKLWSFQPTLQQMISVTSGIPIVIAPVILLRVAEGLLQLTVAEGSLQVAVAEGSLQVAVAEGPLEIPVPEGP